jgi:dinuclear metal center YbgI/SA1388 family protein
MSASHRIQDVIDLMVALAPPRLAADWDNVGLMVGDPSRPLKGVTVALDPTFEAVEEAVGQGSNLIVVHHPLLFKPPRSLDLRKEPGRTLQALIKADCALYAAHTNLDATAVNVALAEALGLHGTDLLHRTGEQPAYKVAVFVPAAEVPRVLEAAWAAGAGRDERYERTAYEILAKGTFRPRPGSDPAEGTPGEQTQTDERRLELFVPAAKLAAVRAALMKAHPYEEPAMDVIQLHGAGEPEGWGLVGDLARPVPLAELGRMAKGALGIQAARIVGPADREIRRVAWLGGSGGDYWKEALAAKADAYITGEVRHHAALDALAAGLCFVEVGHVGSEQPVVPFLASWLRERLGAGVPVRWLHQADPFVVV